MLAAATGASEQGRATLQVMEQQGRETLEQVRVACCLLIFQARYLFACLTVLYRTATPQQSSTISVYLGDVAWGARALSRENVD